jgi:topoisomerase IA-like protein
MRIKPGSTVIIPKGTKASDIADHLANNSSKLMLERDVAPKPKKKPTQTAKSSAKPKNSSSKAVASAKAKPKPKAETKVASTDKKNN